MLDLIWSYLIKISGINAHKTSTENSIINLLSINLFTTDINGSNKIYHFIYLFISIYIYIII